MAGQCALKYLRVNTFIEYHRDLNLPSSALSFLVVMDSIAK